jgi:hypothetical protein
VVACRHYYHGEGDAQRLIYVEVLCASDTLEDLHEQMSLMPGVNEDNSVDIVPAVGHSSFVGEEIRAREGRAMAGLDIAQIDARRRPEEEALLDEKIRTELGTGPENYSAEDWRTLRERSRLFLLYPNQVVACRHHYVGDGNDRRLAFVEVVCASDWLEDLHEKLSRLPEVGDDPPLDIVPVL